MLVEQARQFFPQQDLSDLLEQAMAKRNTADVESR